MDCFQKGKKHSDYQTAQNQKRSLTTPFYLFKTHPVRDPSQSSYVWHGLDGYV